jgi:hypothetical protein
MPGASDVIGRSPTLLVDIGLAPESIGESRPPTRLIIAGYGRPSHESYGYAVESIRVQRPPRTRRIVTQAKGLKVGGVEWWIGSRITGALN